MLRPATTTAPRPCLLLVDDTPANLDVLVGMLKDDYDLIVANRGATALRLCDTNPRIDLVLLDVMMPEMDGYEVCQELRRRPRTQYTPIIFLTAKSEIEDLVRGFSCGGNDYVSKPFRPPELLARVRTQLALRFQQEEIESKNVELQSLVHILCHDVANKFAVLRMVFDLVAHHPERDLRDYLTRMALAVDSGIGLTDTVRNLAAAESKGLPLQSVPLRAAVEEVVTLLTDRLQAKELRVVLEIPELTVLAEPWSFKNSVIENLLSNAIKFSRRGATIEFRAAPEGDGVGLTIRDHGIGIPPAMVATLFDVAKNASRVGTEGERGTGFGMPLVRRCVTLYGGTIDVTSRSEADGAGDTGTEFRLKLRVPAAS